MKALRGAGWSFAMLLGLLASAGAEEFNWNNIGGQNFLTGIRNQGSAGTCWAFAAVGALEARYKITRNDPLYNPNFSEQHLVNDGVAGGVNGGGAYSSLGRFEAIGCLRESECPYTAEPPPTGWVPPTGWESRVCKITSRTSSLVDNTDALKASLKQYGPLCVSMYASTEFYTPGGSIPPIVDGTNHAVVVIGFKDDASVPQGGYWIIKNSWGGSSYYYIPYGSIEYHGGNSAIDGAAYFTGPLANATWAGGAGTWKEGQSTSWTASGAAYSWENIESQALFSSLGGAVTLDGRVIAHGLTFATGATGYAFSGGALTITAGGIDAQESVAISAPVTIGGPQTWTTAAGHTLSVSGAVHTVISALTIDGDGTTELSGAIDYGGALPTLRGAGAGLFKKGSGTLRFAAGEQFADPIPLTVDSGAVALNGNNQSIGALAGSGGTIVLGGATLTVNADDGTSTHAGVITGNGTVVKAGKGTLTLSGTNTFTGNPRVAAGALRADYGTGWPTGTCLELHGGVLESASAVTRSLGTGGGEVDMRQGGGFSASTANVSVNLGNQATPSGVAWNTGYFVADGRPLVFGSTTAEKTVTLRNPIALGAVDREIVVNDNAASTTDIAVLEGVVSGGGGIVKRGAGVLALTAANSYSGPTTLREGVLRAGLGQGIPAASRLVFQGGVWELSAACNMPLGVEAGQIDLSGGGGFAAQGANRQVNLGGLATPATVDWGAGQFVGDAVPLIFGAAPATSAVEFLNPLNLGAPATATTREIRVDDASGSSDYADLQGVVSGGNANTTLRKTGKGTLKLSAANTYNGKTALNDGTLVAGGSSAAGSGPFGIGALSLVTGTIRADTNARTIANAVSLDGDVDFGGSGDGTLTFSGPATVTALRLFDVKSTTVFSGQVSSATVLTKTGSGTLVFSGPNALGSKFYLENGAWRADYGMGWSSTTAVVLRGGVLEVTTDLARSLGTSAGKLSLVDGGGFAAYGGTRHVALNSGAALTWDSTSQFVDADHSLVFGSTTANAKLVFDNPVNLGSPSAAADRTINVNDNSGSPDDCTEFAGMVSGGANARLVKGSAGTLVLSNANTYSGGTKINSGVIVVAGDSIAGTNGPLGTGLLSLAGGTLCADTTPRAVPNPIEVTGSSGLNTAGAAPLTLTGNVALKYTATLTVEGSVSFTNVISESGSYGITKAGSGTLRLAAANTYTGRTTLNAGTLLIAADSSTASGPVGLGELRLVGGAIVPDDVDRSLSNALTLGGNVALGEVNGKRLTFSGAATLTGTRTLTVNNETTFGGAVGGSYGLTKTGPGTLQLGGGSGDAAPNTFSGTTTVNDGTLALNKQAGVNAVAGALIVNTGAVRWNQPHQVANVAVTVNGGTLDFNGQSDDFSHLFLYGGEVRNAATISLSRTGVALTMRNTSLTANVSLTGASGGSIEYQSTNGGTAALAGSLNLGSVTRTFSIADGLNAVDMSVSANITASGTVGLTKTGSGTLALSGNNSYTGPTTVSQGVLRLSAASALPGGVGPTGGTSNLAIAANAIVELDVDFNRPLGTGGDAVRFTGAGGFAAASGRRTVNFGGSGATVAWGASNFIASGQYFNLGSSGGNGTVVIANPLSLGSSSTYQYVYVADGAADVDAELAGSLTGGAGLVIDGPGVLALSGVNNSPRTYVWSNIRPMQPAVIANSTLYLAYGGVLELTDGFGNFSRAVGSGTGKVAWYSGDGGFGAVGNNKTVNLGGQATPLTWNSTDFVSNDAALVLSSPASNAKVTVINPLNLNGKSQKVLVNDGAAAIDGELAGVLSNGGLIKEAAGTLELSATNTYTGDTTVSAGTLIAHHGIAGDGSAALTGTTTIAAGARLQASHICQNQLVIEGQVQILAAGGTSVVNFLNIANGSGSFSWSADGGIEPAGLGDSGASPVPEPATWGLLAMAFLTGLVTRRRNSSR